MLIIFILFDNTNKLYNYFFIRLWFIAVDVLIEFELREPQSGILYIQI